MKITHYPSLKFKKGKGLSCYSSTRTRSFIRSPSLPVYSQLPFSSSNLHGKECFKVLFCQDNRKSEKAWLDSHTQWQNIQEKEPLRKYLCIIFFPFSLLFTTNPLGLLQQLVMTIIIRKLSTLKIYRKMI